MHACVNIFSHALVCY